MLFKKHNFRIGLKMRNQIKFVGMACLILLSFSALAHSQIIPFDSERWDIQGEEKKIGDYLGQKSLYLKGAYAIVKDSEFTDGIIEFDVAFTQERNFTGVMWRLEDLRNYE